MGDGSPFTSALSAGEFAAIRSVGFEPVGQVMGTSVHSPVTKRGQLDCMARSQDAYAARLSLPYDRVLLRLRQECFALGADGVVGATIRRRTVAGAVETTAIGTAVRATGARRLYTPFIAHLNSHDFAKLVASGWMPVGTAYGFAVDIVHAYAPWGWQPNTEMRVTTGLVQRVRQAARKQLVADIARQGGVGFVLARHDHERHLHECVMREGREDLVLESSFLGTAIVPFRTKSPLSPKTLTVMPL
ncbi:heavy metal-binding domain-containing protein [Nonomuraea sp. NPDC050663]|uniref:heavy metal-binding domain-containing protein n=1 Tax=Nonomuraea sp. NPDC050663 TaxID=3364370 RepID=UPI0037A1EA11